MRATNTFNALSRRATAGVALAVLGAIGAGCAGTRTSPAEELQALLRVVPSDAAPVTQPERPAYRLRPGDQIGVRVFADPSLDSTEQIQPDGRVSIAWVGTIPASGRSLEEIERDIEAALGVYLRHPEVAVTLDGFGDHRVYVTGEVGVPGAYPLDPGQTVLGAIAAAGGFRTSANPEEVVLLRRSSETEASVHTVNVERILKGSKDFADPVAQHLDIIHVPRTLIADLNLFVDQFFSRLRPVFTFYLEGWEAFNVDQIRVIRVTRTIN